MDFYLTDPSTGREVHFPINPEEVTIKADTQVQTVSVLNLGEIALPRGRRATQYSWSGFWPGGARYGSLPFPLELWRPPIDVLFDLETWHGENTRLRLLVTETELNKDVFIASLQHSWKGGHGDLHYQLELTEYRPLVVRIDGAGETVQAGEQVEALSRAEPETPTSYTVASGDTLWAIAKRVLGDGSRWGEIYEANADTIGPDANQITVGVELRVPGGTAPEIIE